MLECHLVSHLVLTVIQSLFGILVNGIILIVNGTDLIKQRKLIPLDLLVSCLAISRMGIQLAFFYINLALLSLVKFPQVTEKLVVFTFVNDLGLWFATWLSVYYCTKIATIAHPLLFWLKMKISKLVPWLILGSLLYACSTSAVHIKYKWAFYGEGFLGLFFPNVTTHIKVTPTLQSAFLLAEFALPFFIFLISSLLLIFSLGRHTWQVRNTWTGPRNSHTRAYIRAFHSILSFLALYLCHYLIVALFFFQIFNLRSFLFLFCTFVVGSYHSIHSITLILGNPKMKQNAKALLLLRK
ncbi:taste receptor type 2 member 1 [Ovis canadensis]|uniref:taste receptor type 2 member 1 n=1 Tax=Ovis canadensis TaxID=37174 RepID=UPI0037502622